MTAKTGGRKERQVRRRTTALVATVLVCSAVIWPCTADAKDVDDPKAIAIEEAFGRTMDQHAAIIEAVRDNGLATFMDSLERRSPEVHAERGPVAEAMSMEGVQSTLDNLRAKMVSYFRALPTQDFRLLATGPSAPTGRQAQRFEALLRQTCAAFSAYVDEAHVEFFEWSTGELLVRLRAIGYDLPKLSPAQLAAIRQRGKHDPDSHMANCGKEASAALIRKAPAAEMQ